MQKFFAYENAKEMCRLLPPVMESTKKKSADLADQIERAATSIMLNLAEGNRRMGKDRLKYFRTAEGSALELRAAFDIVSMWGYADVAAIEPILDRQIALMWGLMHSKKLRG